MTVNVVLLAAPSAFNYGDAPTQIVDDFRSFSLTRPSARTVLRALHGTVNTDRDFALETPVLIWAGTDPESLIDMPDFLVVKFRQPIDGEGSVPLTGRKFGSCPAARRGGNVWGAPRAPDKKG